MPSQRLEALARGVQTAVSRAHGISLAAVVLIREKTVVKTTSGKISRAGCKKAYLAGSLEVLYRWEGAAGVDAEAATSLEVASYEDDGEGGGAEGGAPVAGGGDASAAVAASSTVPAVSAATLRAMTVEEVRARVERSLVSVSSQGPSPLAAPIPTDKSMISLGLDSMTLVQFSGVLQKR